MIFFKESVWYYTYFGFELRAIGKNYVYYLFCFLNMARKRAPTCFKYLGKLAPHTG